MNRNLSPTRIGVAVTCSYCKRTKDPIGRSVPHGQSGCDGECPGYRQDPRPGSLWPGESEEDFGFPVNTDGTTDAVKLV